MKAIYCCLFFLLFSAFHSFSQESYIDSVKKIAFSNKSNDSLFIKNSFIIADEYMNYDQYDSAQVWLNYIAEVLPLKKPSLFNYFLSTRQAEVYYYNGLQRLGLQESERSLSIAKALNDSFLLADSYNFLGLFYMNLDSNRSSIPFFKEGILYCKQPPYAEQYMSLTKPHHLYGNMAEAYGKMGMYDSALVFGKRSLHLAKEIQWGRGVAVAYNLLGLIFSKMNLPDSGILYHANGVTVSKESGDFDVELLCKGGLGVCYAVKNEKETAFKFLKEGFDLLNENPQMNNLFYMQFLNDAAAVYKKYNATALLVKTLEKINFLENNRMRKNDLQMNTLLNASLKNETRLLNFEVDDARQKQHLSNTRLMIVLLAMGLLLVTGFLLWYNYRGKLRLAKVRNKISQDLHDDVGASLSSLQIYGSIAERTFQKDPGKAMEMIKKIATQSKQVMDDMSDIVWSMKSNSTGGTTLETKVKNYAAELLQEKQIEFASVIQPEAETALESMKARRNILLIIREILNNTVKYSKATAATLHIYVQDKNWVMEVADNGVGLDTTKKYSGNGLKNISNRTEELNGSFTLEGNSGTRYVFIFPLTVITDTGW